MKQNDEIEDLFQSTFDDFSVEPPQNVKSSIDAALFNNGGKRKRFAMLLSALLIVTTISSIIYFSNSSNSKNIQKKNTNSISENNLKSSENTLKSESKTDSDSSLGTTSEQNESTRSKSSTSVNPTETVVNSNNSISRDTKVKSLVTSKLANKNKDQDLVSISHANKIDTKKSDGETTAKKLSKPTENKTGLFNEVKGVNTADTKKSNLNNISSNETSSITPSTSENEKINKAEEISTQEIGINKNTAVSADKINNTENAIASTDKEIDSLIAENIKNEVINSTPELSIDENKMPIWLLSLRSGTSFSSNKMNQLDSRVSEKNAFFVNVEASYQMKNKLSLSTGLQYNKMSTEFNYSATYNYNTFNHYDTILSYNDTANPTLADTSYLAVYDSNFMKYNGSQVYNQTSFSLPLYIGYTQKLYNKIYLDANAGMIISYQQAKKMSSDVNAPDETIRNVGLKLCIRPQIRYQFGQFGVSISSNLGYDLVPTLNWNGITRKRLFSEIGVGIHYQF